MPPQENFRVPEADHLSEKEMCENISSNPCRISTISQNNDLHGKMPKISEKPKDMDFDELLPYVGEFGFYQKILFVLMIPFAFFVAWVYFSQIFITLVPEEHWCKIPELENLTMEERIALAIPRDSNHGGHVTHSKCSMYAVNYTEILEKGITVADPNWPITHCKHGWEFNYTVIPYSTVATEVNGFLLVNKSKWLRAHFHLRGMKSWLYEVAVMPTTILISLLTEISKVYIYNLLKLNIKEVTMKFISLGILKRTQLEWVCDNAALPSSAQSIFFVGAIFGGLIFGWIADRYGRIPALVGANIVGFIAGVATAFSTSFWEFAACRFLFGFAFDNCFTMMYILVLEYVGPKWRTFVANMSIAIFFTFAACLLPWIAYFLADWRMTSLVTSIPLVLAIATPWFVPESARWIVSQGKVDKAIGILKKFEKINGTKVPEEIYAEFKDSCARINKEEEAGKSYSVLDLFKTPRLRNITLLLIVIWMMISLVFDGHVRNVNNLGLDVFVTFTIAAATELPADTFLTLVLDRWGRRWLACGSMVVSGIFSVWACAVSDHIYAASLAIMGRFFVNISYNIGLQYAAELLPTVVRAQGVALIHIMGYVASIAAPFVVYLDFVSPVLPLLVLGTLGILGGILSLLLPETLDKDLPQTLLDGEDFGKDQGIWDMPCLMKKPDDEEMTLPRMTRAIERSSIRASMRASLRGEALRSSMIQRSSVRSRKSLNSVIEVARL